MLITKSETPTVYQCTGNITYIIAGNLFYNTI